jgi:4-hydroxyproline epimerase
MIERRQTFMKEYDWIRRSLMFEPRGHDIMSGSILYPSTRDDCDVAVLYIEVSGCLPMCGHGTIGTVTFMIERGIVTPKEPGVVRLDTPAGVVEARYQMNGEHGSRCAGAGCNQFRRRLRRQFLCDHRGAGKHARHG